MTRAHSYVSGYVRIVVATATALVLVVPYVVSAATLYLSPSTRTLSVGERATVTLYVDAAGVAINAVSGVIGYDASALQALSVGTAGSVVNFWVQEPGVTAGSVSFEGVVLNPGYAGARGKVIDVTFVARKETTLSINVVQASVLANDGLGTNVLTGTSGATFSIQESAPQPKEAPVSPEDKATTTAPPIVITSSTHQAEDAWYREQSGTFLFALPAGADAVRLVLSRSKTATPSVLYTPALAEKRIDELPEGISYLVAQARANGIWSESATRRIQVDYKSPTAFTASLRARTDGTDPMLIIDATAKDALSGVAGYRVHVAGGTATSFASGVAMTLGPLAPQSYAIEVVAYDKAGNETAPIVLTTEVTALAAPVLHDVSATVPWNGTLRVRGSASHAGGVAHLALVGEKGTYKTSVPVEQDGTFLIERVHDLPPGPYEVSVMTTDSRGAQSIQAHGGTTEFLARPIGDTLIAFGKDLGAGFFVLLALLGFAALASGLYLKFARWHGTLRNEVREANMTVEKSFNLLREDIEAFMVELAKESGRRKLTSSERRFVKAMKENFDEASSIIKKEIRDVADGVK